MFDLIIIGGGPAGVSAALYAVRAGIKAAVVENGGSALQQARKIENYYGAAAADGAELYQRGLAQAKSCGAEIIHGEVLTIDYDGQFTITLPQEKLTATAVILATGSQKRSPRVKNIKELEGRGVSYCAVCDGFFYRRKKVAVLGSGLYALHEAEALRPLATEVIILTDGEASDLAAKAGYKTDVRKLSGVEGAQKLEKICFADGTEEAFDGLFIALGTAGSTDLARKLGAELNGAYIKTDADGATNIPGLFAAGDCTGTPLQIAKAVSEGMTAGMAAVKYLRTQKSKL